MCGLTAQEVTNSSVASLRKGLRAMQVFDFGTACSAVEKVPRRPLLFRKDFVTKTCLQTEINPCIFHRWKNEQESG